MEEDKTQNNPDDVQPEDATSAQGSDETKNVTIDDLTLSKEPSQESVPAANSYNIKPALHDKFKANAVREIIRSVLTETLSGKAYSSGTVKPWSVKIANDINACVRELKMKRYKHIVQVIIGEMKGAGVKSGVRCLWDSETDGYTTDSFINDTIFCVVVVFAVYLY